MKITEAILTGPNTIELQNHDVPLLNDDELLVEVSVCGVCSSEFPVLRGEVQGKCGVSFRYADYPCFLGHEVSGVVVDKGTAVSQFNIGDRVTGVAYEGSGFATHVVAPASMMVKVADNIPLDYALGEPVMAVMNAVRMAEPELGDQALLVGDGFMSLMTVAALSQYGLKNIIVTGHHAERLSIAKALGATTVVNSKDTDAYWAVRELLDGDDFDRNVTLWKNGVDIAFEYAGKMETLQLCASLCKPKQRAKLMMTSFYPEEPFTLGHYLINRAPSLVPSFPAHSKDVLDDLDRGMWALEQGTFQMDKLVTHAFELNNIDAAMAYASGRTDGYIKGIVTPSFDKLETNVRQVS
ncbi:MAG: zinc-binding dehydrogenase [Magnetovibrio sp.]|nr:zinc-binding dehydrogenase [Magnetovibrio sp.]